MTLSYYWIWLRLALVVAALIRLQTSRQGRAWNYIREDEIAAGAMGVDVRAEKRLAFVLGAALAGAAGNIYAAKFQVIAPASPEPFKTSGSSLPSPVLKT